ncbi:PqqD family peptide modification chaperone [Phycicoccus flavus]|uniref:PqqD family peptide modification chaperone n=1 Tax=Phycicoccus flavus TaxID=2502783 RepID=A0A8T6R544_9MICO|nr:PqqD family peptide modification chaperone [Phycicoccus flavus]NHA68794.1 PqqD family peptide modification chaperone [Phycicoccus flavus]
MTGPLVLAAQAGWVEADEVVYAAVLPDGPPLVLQGSGALVWHAALPGGSLEEVVGRVAAAAGTSADVVAADVAAFVDALVTVGLLVRS